MDTLERYVFENALEIMSDEKNIHIISRKILKDIEGIKRSILSYYESTEEYEKCIEVINFFNKIQNNK